MDLSPNARLIRPRGSGGEGIYPYFHALESRQDTEVIMEGKRRIMLGSNNYLASPPRRRSLPRRRLRWQSTARAAPARDS